MPKSVDIPAATPGADVEAIEKLGTVKAGG